MDILLLFLKGIAIGMVNIIPGVSGGTLAVIFGIYNKFINAITLNVKKLWENKKFVIPVVLGMALGVLLFSKLIGILYNNFPDQTNYFFTGLIIGSLPMIWKLMTVKKDENSKLTKGTISSIVICALVGCAAVVVFTICEGRFEASELNGALPKLTFGLGMRIFIAGVLGAIAMIIPGISGSLLMLMMGVYPIIVTSIPALFTPDTTLNALLLLLPNGVGVLLGLLCGAKLIGYLISRFPNAIYALIFGLIFGSIYAVFPGFSLSYGILKILICLLSLVMGFSLAFFSAKVENK